MMWLFSFQNERKEIILLFINNNTIIIYTKKYETKLIGNFEIIVTMYMACERVCCCYWYHTIIIIIIIDQKSPQPLEYDDGLMMIGCSDL